MGLDDVPLLSEEDGPGRKSFSIFLGLVLFLLFPGVVLGIRTFFYRDFGVLAYPTLFFARQSFWAGELPLWNPYSNCGAPFLAQWGTMFFYPGSLWYYLLPVPWSVNVFCLAHLFWAGLGMYQLAWSWTANRLAASVAGVAFVMNGITLATLIWPNYTVAIGWMPWVIWSVERCWERPAPFRWIALASATFQLLAGVPELVILTWTVVAVIAGVALFQNPPAWRRIARPTFGLILSSAGLCAVQLLPFFELLKHSQRDVQFATSKWSMPSFGWANFLVPLFHNFQTPQGNFFQMGQEFLSSTYPGILALALSLSALWITRSWKVRILFLLAFAACLMAGGDHSLLYRIVKGALPMVGFARYPIKLLFLFAFVISVLAAFAVAQLLEDKSRRKPCLVLFSVSAFLCLTIAAVLIYARFHPFPYEQFAKVWTNGAMRALFLALGLAILHWRLRARTPRSKRIAHWSLLAVIAVDAVTHLPAQNPTLPADILAPNFWQEANRTNGPALSEGRMMISPYAEKRLLLSGVPDFYKDIVGKRLAGWSHLNLLDRLPKVNGSSTLQLRAQKTVQEFLYSSADAPFTNLERFLAVQLKTAPGEIVEWQRQPAPLPLITFGQRPVFAPAARCWQLLTNRDFNPETTVLLPEDAGPLAPHHPADGQVLRARIENNRIRCDVAASDAGVLVIAESYDAPWHAYVDGASAPIWPANGAFQAVALPSGRHHVEIRYEDWALSLGALISVALLIIEAARFWMKAWWD